MEDGYPGPDAQPRTLTVAIAAGGTLDHIRPGLALADAVVRLRPDTRVIFIGAPGGLENRIIPASGFPLKLVQISPFRGGAGLQRITLPARLMRSSKECARMLRKERVDVVVGMGGYVSAPAVIGAELGRIPSVIHEANARPGRANRVSARFSKQIALGFPGAGEYFPAGSTCRTVGMPLSPDPSEFDREQIRSDARWAIDAGDDFVVLIDGGGHDAARLNHAAVDLATAWRERDGLRILLSVGSRELGEIQRRIADRGLGGRITVSATLDSVNSSYAAADLVVCRSGPSVIAQVTRLGLAAIFVPNPRVPHDYETENAKLIVAAGAGELLPEGQLDASRLSVSLDPLLGRSDRRVAMAKRAGERETPYAARDLAKWAFDLTARSPFNRPLPRPAPAVESTDATAGWASPEG